MEDKPRLTEADDADRAIPVVRRTNEPYVIPNALYVQVGKDMTTAEVIGQLRRLADIIEEQGNHRYETTCVVAR